MRIICHKTLRRHSRLRSEAGKIKDNAIRNRNVNRYHKESRVWRHSGRDDPWRVATAR